MKNTSIRATIVVLGVAVAQLAIPVASAAPPPGPVDESLLVPSLNPDFAPWTCTARQTGPVCTGEWDAVHEWQPFDFSCDDVPVYASSHVQRRSTRYYDWDHLNYDRYVHQNDVDELSTSPTGPATATITARSRFSEPFAVPGDPSTITVVTQGVPLEVRPVQGAPLLRMVGTIVEPPGEVGTFTGHVTDGAVTTRYENAPLPEVVTEEAFVSAVCEAVTGTP